MSARETVIQRLREAMPGLQARFPIRSLSLFGSVSRGEDSSASDVDLLVEFDAPVGMRFIHLAHELSALLGRKVDLVSRGGVKPRYLQAIEADLVHV